METATENKIKMNEGDIFHWRYADEDIRQNRPFGLYIYHCKSRIAVFKNGYLRDTYWHEMSNNIVDPSEVILEFQGNPADMTIIPKWERGFYRHEDIVDMNHANNSNAPVYLKSGAKRDAKTMLEYFEYAKTRAEEKARSALDRANDCAKAIARINDGDVDGNFPSYVQD